LTEGGNAIDAAVAALVALSVVEPMMVGPLGGGLTHIRLANGRHTVIDGLSTAPAAAWDGMFDDAALARRLNLVGPLAMAISCRC
jgi:gamma-glutamyltranspeptidase / glutathione hydrolase